MNFDINCGAICQNVLKCNVFNLDFICWFELASEVCRRNKGAGAWGALCWGLSDCSPDLHGSLENSFCSTSSGKEHSYICLGFFSVFLWKINENSFCFLQLNFGISGDQTQNVLWRLSNGELDNIKPKVFISSLNTILIMKLLTILLNYFKLNWDRNQPGFIARNVKCLNHNGTQLSIPSVTEFQEKMQKYF